MAGSADRSQSDLGVLRQSHRGKFIALVVLLVAAGATLAREYGRTAPSEPEKIDHVFVVTHGNYGYGRYLETLGFVSQETRRELVADELREVLPEAEETGAAAILKFADWTGYAYVAFEDPATLDFSGLNILGGVPTFEAHHRFAVLSAGDFASPHKLTVNARPSEVMSGPKLDLLSALFAQEALASTLRGSLSDTPEILRVRPKVEKAIYTYKAIAEAEATVAEFAEKARILLIDKVPTLLGGAHESVSPIALADGGILLLTRKIHFSNGHKGFSADLDRTWNFSYVSPGDDPIGGRVPCSSLLGGSFTETGAPPSFRSSPQGDALLIHNEGVSQLFTLKVGGSCRFVDHGELTVPLAHNEDPGEPHASARVARVRVDNSKSVVYLVKPVDEVPLELVRSALINFGRPVWLASDMLAVDGSPKTGKQGEGLFLLSPDHPDKALRVGAFRFSVATDIGQIALAPPDHKERPRLVVVTTDERGVHLVRVELPKPLATLMNDALAGVLMDAQPQAVRNGKEPLVVVDLALNNDTILTHEVSIRDPVVSADGQLVAFSTEKEIALMSFYGGPVRILTRNALEDHSPMFTANSKHLVFHTRFPIEGTSWVFTTGRSLPVGP